VWGWICSSRGVDEDAPGIRGRQTIVFAAPRCGTSPRSDGAKAEAGDGPSTGRAEFFPPPPRSFRY